MRSRVAFASCCVGVVSHEPLHRSLTPIEWEPCSAGTIEVVEGAKRGEQAAGLPSHQPNVTRDRSARGLDVPASGQREYEVTSPLVAGPIPVRPAMFGEIMRPDHLSVIPEREQSQRTRACHAPRDLHLPPDGDGDSIEHERPELSVVGDPPYLDQSVRGSTRRTSGVTTRAGGEADDR